MAPGDPSPVSHVFTVECEPVAIQAWGLLGDDVLAVERVKRSAGSLDLRKGNCCATVKGDDPQVVMAQPMLACGCDDVVALSACRDRIIIDQPGEYRLRWLLPTGCTCPERLGDIFVEKMAHCGPVDSYLRGYGASCNGGQS